MAYILNRLLTQLIPVMFVASLLVFLVVRLIPGDPAAASVGENATAEAYQQARERLGLNEPIHTHDRSCSLGLPGPSLRSA